MLRTGIENGFRLRNEDVSGVEVNLNLELHNGFECQKMNAEARGSSTSSEFFSALGYWNSVLFSE